MLRNRVDELSRAFFGKDRLAVDPKVEFIVIDFEEREIIWFQSKLLKIILRLVVLRAS